MSLINEALRKARKDAAERDAEERGVTYRPPRAHLPTERSWLPALAGVVLGALIAAVAFFVLLPDPPPESESSTSETVVPESTVGSEDVGDERMTAANAGDPVAQPVSETPSPQAEPAVETSESKESKESKESNGPKGPKEPKEPKTVPPEPAPEPTEPTAPTESTPTVEPPPIEPGPVGPMDEPVYVLEAEVDGVSLRLDFIVWAASPFAQINGRQVSVGQAVEGFMVRAIEREEVTLEGQDGTFHLRVR